MKISAGLETQCFVFSHLENGRMMHLLKGLIHSKILTELRNLKKKPESWKISKSFKNVKKIIVWEVEYFQYFSKSWNFRVF